MAICKNCGKGLIIRNGKCVYCGAVPDGDCANNSGQYNGYSQRKRQRYDSKDNKPNLIYQIFLVFMVLAIIIPISFAEYETKNGSWWGIATMYGVNGSIVLWSVITMVYAVRGHFSSRNKTWRIYYEWIHYPVEIIFAVVGYLVLYNYDETWILLFNLLTGTWPIVGAHCIEKTAGYNQWDF